MDARKLRRRASINTCTTCWKLNVKCDASGPPCSFCLKLGASCGGLHRGILVEKRGRSKLHNPAVVAIAKAIDASRQQDEYTNGAAFNAGGNSETCILVPEERKVDEIKDAFQPRLIQILSAASFDPFDSFCVKQISPKTYGILDLSMATQWTVFAASQQQKDMVALKKQIMSYVMNDQLSLYTCLFAAFCHHAFFVESSDEQKKSQLIRLWLKQQMTQRLIEFLRNNKGQIPEEILMSVLFMATQGGGETVSRNPLSSVQQRKSMKKLANLEYWCALEAVDEHLEAFYDMICQLGGLRNVSSLVVTAGIMFDIFNSWRRIEPPRLELPFPLGSALAMRRWVPDDRTSKTQIILASELLATVACMFPEPATYKLHEVVNGIKTLILDFEQIDRTKGSNTHYQPDQTTLLRIRSVVLYELLQLPDRGPQIDKEGSDALIYELCRVSCLMFIQIETFPILGTNPNMPRKLLKKAVPLLRRVISTEPENLSNICLWVVILSLLLAYEDYDMTRELQTLNIIKPFLLRAMTQLTERPWAEISDQMLHFLWRRPDCDWIGSEALEWAKRHLGADRKSVKSPGSDDCDVKFDFYRDVELSLFV